MIRISNQRFLAASILVIFGLIFHSVVRSLYVGHSDAWRVEFFDKYLIKRLFVAECEDFKRKPERKMSYAGFKKQINKANQVTNGSVLIVRRRQKTSKHSYDDNRTFHPVVVITLRMFNPKDFSPQGCYYPEDVSL